jgi:hypothetical protein
MRPLLPDTGDTVIWAPDDWWRYRPKQVEHFTGTNKLYIVAFYWTIIDVNNGDFVRRSILNLPEFVLWLETCQSKMCRENQNTQFNFNNFLPQKLCRFWDIVKKYRTSSQTTDDNMAHAQYTLDNYRGADKSLARPGRKQATCPAFYGTWRFITTFTTVNQLHLL